MINLESTKTAFDTWRAAKTKTNTPVPTELWNMVAQLLVTYERAEICRALGITSSQIKQYCIALPANKNHELHSVHSVDNNFVEATPTLTARKNDEAAELTVKGETKSLHLYLPASMLKDVLPVLGKML